MYKPRRAGKAKETERKQPVPLPEVGAVVTGIEAHPKKPHMYRISLKLDPHSEKEPDGRSKEASEAEPEMSDWNEEVDTLIAGAQSAKETDETLITVHEDTLVSLRLLKGRRLSAEEVAALKQDEQKEEAYRSALLMLERKARTTAELSHALRRKGYAPEAVSACLERLRTQRMLDDAAFARRYTEQRAAGQRKGRMLIRQELLQRGVERQDIDRAIDGLDGEVERESALALARKRWPITKGNDRERKLKLMGLLMRRGFPSNIVKWAAQQAAEEAGEDDSDEGFEDGIMHDPEFMED